MDVWHKALKWIDHNRGLVAALMVSVLCCVWLVGCPITTKSLIDSSRKVTVTELQAEDIALTADLDKRKVQIESLLDQYNVDVNAHNAKVELSEQDIQHKATWRAKVVEIVGSIGQAAATGTLTPEAGVAAILQLTTLLSTIGLVYDNRRKDKVINSTE